MYCFATKYKNNFKYHIVYISCIPVVPILKPSYIVLSVDRISISPSSSSLVVPQPSSTKATFHHNSRLQEGGEGGDGTKTGTGGGEGVVGRLRRSTRKHGKTGDAGGVVYNGSAHHRRHCGRARRNRGADGGVTGETWAGRWHVGGDDGHNDRSSRGRSHALSRAVGA